MKKTKLNEASAGNQSCVSLETYSLVDVEFRHHRFPLLLVPLSAGAAGASISWDLQGGLAGMAGPHVRTPYFGEHPEWEIDAFHELLFAPCVPFIQKRHKAVVRFSPACLPVFWLVSGGS